MEKINKSAEELLSDTETWNFIQNCPPTLQRTFAKNFSARTSVIAHLTFPNLRLVIEEVQKKTVVACWINTLKNVLEVNEVNLNLDPIEPFSRASLLYSVKGFPETDQNNANKRSIRFGPYLKETDLVFGSSAQQAIITYANCMLTIWPAMRVQLSVRNSIPQDYLLSRAVRYCSTLLIDSKNVFVNMQSVLNYSKNLKNLAVRAKLPADFKLAPLLKMEIIFLDPARSLIGSDLIWNLSSKLAVFPSTQLKNNDINHFIQVWQRKELPFEYIQIEITPLIMKLVLKGTVFLRTLKSEANDRNEDDSSVGDVADYNFYLRPIAFQKRNLPQLVLWVCSEQGIKTLKIHAVPKVNLFNKVLKFLEKKKELEAMFEKVDAELEMVRADIEELETDERFKTAVEQLKKKREELRSKKRTTNDKMEQCRKNLTDRKVKQLDDGSYVILR